MSRALRVVHLPARTPYVRKIVSADFSILNGSDTAHGVVPDSVGAQWLLDRRPLDWFDVLHLHHIEFEDGVALEQLLVACEASGVKIVYTAHDITPMFIPFNDFQARMELLRSSGARWIGLTAASVEQLEDHVHGLGPVTVIPHGFVVKPDVLSGKTGSSPPNTAEYLLYGALRPNRDHLSSLANWSLSVADRGARLNLLMRALRPADFERYNVSTLLTIIKSDARIHASMRAYPTDDDVVTAGLNADALLLPYLYGSHSGQLEFAFDLNLLPVCSSVGHLKEQYYLHKDLVTEPIWFDWADGREFLFGERFVAALEVAHARVRCRAHRGPRDDFLEYRREEHGRFLEAHHAIYAA